MRTSDERSTRRGWVTRRLRRRWRARERGLIALVLLTVAFTVLASVQVGIAHSFPMASLMIPLLLGSLLLSPRVLPWFVVFVMAMLILAVARQPALTDVQAASVVVYYLLGLIVLLVSFRRSRLGVAGWQGEDMFVDLRDRILNQGGVPELPPGWAADSALAASGGTHFAGDVLVVCTPEPGRLEVVVVDVSGSGEQAGTRALQLSGAFGGLLGALPAEEFLPAANAYLLRQEWEEGFASAAHASIDLASGAYAVRTAGHPPVVHRSGAGWTELPSGGPLLGLLEDVEYDPATGSLGPGDTLLLYTDGMVERRRRDIDSGIARLLERAEAELAARPDGAASRLVRSLGSRDDDRAVVLVRRLPEPGPVGPEAEADPRGPART